MPSGGRGDEEKERKEAQKAHAEVKKQRKVDEREKNDEVAER